MFSSPVTSWIAVIYEILIVVSQAVKDTPFPQTPEEWFTLILKVLPGFGIFFAKDWNKSNAQNPKAVSETVPAEGVPTMKPLQSILLIASLFTLSACSTMPAFLGGYKHTIEALIDANTAGTYEATITKNGQVLLKKTYICVATEATLPKCEETKLIKTPDAHPAVEPLK